MPFGQIVIGPPGSGKTTYVWGLYQVRLFFSFFFSPPLLLSFYSPLARIPFSPFPLLSIPSPLLPPRTVGTTAPHPLHSQFFTALSRPILLVNLDPASPSPPFPNSISISSLISLSDAMSAHKLGPNGAMLYCLEYLEANIEWLEEELEGAMGRMERGEGAGGVEGEDEEDGGDDPMEETIPREKGRKWKREEIYVVFDTPGQVELSTDHGSLKRIIERLHKKMGFRVRLSSLLPPPPSSLPSSPLLSFPSLRTDSSPPHPDDSRS